jgi:S-adenosylmethionine:tRNA-ribosyltransferase-isomerase (queuine synthetase)
MPATGRFEVPTSTAAAVTAARADGGRVSAVATTVVRALESVAESLESVAGRQLLADPYAAALTGGTSSATCT